MLHEYPPLAGMRIKLVSSLLICASARYKQQLYAGGANRGACAGGFSMQPSAESPAAQCGSPAFPLSDRPLLLCFGILWIQLGGDCQPLPGAVALHKQDSLNQKLAMLLQGMLFAQTRSIALHQKELLEGLLSAQSRSVCTATSDTANNKTCSYSQNDALSCQLTS